MNDWKKRHNIAWSAPRGVEAPIVNMIKGWIDYANQHQQRYDSSIGDDGVLGPEWASVGSSLLGLLNGDLGGLDGGTLDGMLRDTLKRNGFDPDTKDARLARGTVVEGPVR